MKKKIIILGSTGSIGTNTLKIIQKYKKNFEVLVLSAYKNIDKLLKQAKKFSCKNVIIPNNNISVFTKKKFENSGIKIYDSFESIRLITKKKKIYYAMVAISGIYGLKPSLILSNYTKNLAIVNKESLVSGWNLIKKNIKKNKVNFVPIDSEHYSIFTLLRNHSINEIERIYITASGGPFINYNKKDYNKITIKKALRHPNWKMGKKISIDSSTMMNKVFEVIEAKNIFNIPYNKISILTHPKSYIHAIIKFKNGLIKIAAHNPDMKIPIFNSIFNNQNSIKNPKSINLDKLNNLNLKNINIKQFPLVSILNDMPNKNSLYETALIIINDFFVDQFLKKKINYLQLINSIKKISNLEEFKKLKKKPANNINKIFKLMNYVSLKINSLGIYK